MYIYAEYYRLVSGIILHLGWHEDLSNLLLHALGSLFRIDKIKENSKCTSSYVYLHIHGFKHTHMNKCKVDINADVCMPTHLYVTCTQMYTHAQMQG
jgi:hypothetical protein